MEQWQQPEWTHRMQLQLDWTCMSEDRLGPGKGVARGDLEELQARTEAIHNDLRRRREEGSLGFFSTVDDEQILAQTLSFAEDLRGRYRNVVVLGIGGSALGTTALEKALCHPFSKLSPGTGDAARLFVVDNIDPVTFTALLESLDWEHTLVIVISKSGTTAETMSQFLIMRDLLLRRFGEAGAWERIVVITDPAKGYLRTIADREGYRSLSVPPQVGGRFSVLTGVGLLPAALAGIDVAQLVGGARAMDQRCGSSSLWENPAYLNGAYHYLADRKLGLRLQVYLAYADGLYSFADWVRQLVAESLGKRYGLDGNEVYIGPTPIKALGVTDQHSQLQLYMEGPRDKVVTILGVEKFPYDLTIPPAYEDLEGVAYLADHRLGELLHAEQEATGLALTEAGRCNMTLTFPEINAFTMGQALFLYMLQTVYMGALYGVNPLDQPGVEMGKKFAYGMMGRKGFESYRETVERLRRQAGR